MKFIVIKLQLNRNYLDKFLPNYYVKPSNSQFSKNSLHILGYISTFDFGAAVYYMSRISVLWQVLLEGKQEYALRSYPNRGRIYNTLKCEKYTVFQKPKFGILLQGSFLFGRFQRKATKLVPRFVKNINQCVKSLFTAYAIIQSRLIKVFVELI